MTSHLFLFCSFICFSLQCTLAKRVAWIQAFVCFIDTLWLLCETRYVVCSWNVSSGPSIVFWDRINFFNNCIKFSWKPGPVSFLQVKTFSRCGGLWHNNRGYSHTYIVILCERDGFQNWFFTAILNVWRYKDEILVVSLLPYCTVNEFDSFMLKSPITMGDLFLCPNAGSQNWLGGGLYMECTTPVSSTVMSSTFSFSQTEMLFTFRPSLIKTELPCVLCGHSATSTIPGILGLAWHIEMVDTRDGLANVILYIFLLL